MKDFELWSDNCTRISIDSSSLYRHILDVQKGHFVLDEIEKRDRLKSLAKVLDEYERMNKALRLGGASEKLVELLNQWELAEEKRLLFGSESLHAYATMAGIHWKGPPNLGFKWDEHKETEKLHRQAVDSNVLELNVTDQVIFSKSGRMGLIRTLGPISFIRFKQWMATRPDRSAHLRKQDKLHVAFVERLIAAGHLSATADLYY